MRAIAWVLPLLVTSGAYAVEATPSIEDIVSRARAVMDKKPEHAVCKLRIESAMLDKSGKVEHEDKRDTRATIHDGKQEVVTERAWRDGKPLTAGQLADERKQADKQREGHKGGQNVELAPLAAKNAPEQRFELVRQEALWGRPAYVVRVSAKPNGDKNATLANGTLWIDAERFVELKGELTPSEMPPHADWIRVQEQYVPGPKDVAVPSYLHIEGAGHMLFMHKQFRTTLRWSDCR
jgi:hypothetical protein